VGGFKTTGGVPGFFTVHGPALVRVCDAKGARVPTVHTRWVTTFDNTRETTR